VEIPTASLKAEQNPEDEFEEENKEPVDLAEFEYMAENELEKTYDEELKPIPNIMTDPFKEKWNTTKASYRKISRFGHC
jgi:hypothetical protein